MLEFHKDRYGYFQMQTQNAEKYVIPFIEQGKKLTHGTRVMEIGAGEGGVLKAFVNKGCIGVAVEMDVERVENAEKYLAEDISAGRLKYIACDIYKVSAADLDGKFDLIVMKDVIEHIHDQRKLISWLHEFLLPGGMIYFGFPPWQMPYGGHQQMGEKKLAKLPWLHLLPMGMYRGTLRLFGESPINIENLAEIKETGISIERFERIVKETGWKVALKQHYLINPIYEFKFKLKPRKQGSLITKIPWFRNFVTTCVYYVIEKKRLVMNDEG